MNTLTGKRIPIRVGSADKIINVKKLIWESEGIPTELQKLLFGGKQLEGDHTVSDYKIVKGSTLHLLVHSTEGMHFSVETHTDRTLTLEVDSFDSIKSVKNKIQETEGIPADQQRLTFKGMDLQDDRILSDYNIRNGTSLKLDLWPIGSRENMNIGVKTLTGKTINVKMRASDTVEMLKEKIYNKEGMPTGHQNLIVVEESLKMAPSCLIMVYQIGQLFI